MAAPGDTEFWTSDETIRKNEEPSPGPDSMNKEGERWSPHVRNSHWALARGSNDERIQLLRIQKYNDEEAKDTWDGQNQHVSGGFLCGSQVFGNEIVEVKVYYEWAVVWIAQVNLLKLVRHLIDWNSRMTRDPWCDYICNWGGDERRKNVIISMFMNSCWRRHQRQGICYHKYHGPR